MQFECPIESEVAYRHEAVAETEVVDTILTAPTSALSRNAGNGVLEVQWAAPASGVVGWYEVWICTSAGGAFERATPNHVTTRWTRIPNLKFGSTIYAKVRALDPLGVAGPFSALARDAIASRAVTRLRFEDVPGSVIPASAMFACYLNGELLAVTVDTGGTIP
jgi:hypothetical protein